MYASAYGCSNRDRAAPRVSCTDPTKPVSRTTVVDGEKIAEEYCVEYEQGGKERRIGDYRSWYADGTKREESQYQDGKLLGTQTIWSKDGARSTENHYLSRPGDLSTRKEQWVKDGVTHAKETTFDNGRVLRIQPYKDGKKHGLATVFGLGGYKSDEITYESGVQQGPFRSFHKSGSLMAKGTYLKGKRHGVVTQYCLDGKRIHGEITYDHGTVVSSKRVDSGDPSCMGATSAVTPANKSLTP